MKIFLAILLVVLLKSAYPLCNIETKDSLKVEIGKLIAKPWEIYTLVLTPNIPIIVGLTTGNQTAISISLVSSGIVFIGHLSWALYRGTRLKPIVSNLALCNDDLINAAVQRTTYLQNDSETKVTPSDSLFIRTNFPFYPFYSINGSDLTPSYKKDGFDQKLHSLFIDDTSIALLRKSEKYYKFAQLMRFSTFTSALVAVLYYPERGEYYNHRVNLALNILPLCFLATYLKVIGTGSSYFSKATNSRNNHFFGKN